MMAAAKGRSRNSGPPDVEFHLVLFQVRAKAGLAKLPGLAKRKRQWRRITRVVGPAKPGPKGTGTDRPPTASERSSGMVVGMATRKLTITLEADQLERIRTLVESGEAPSVSGFVQHAVGVALDDVAGWGAMLANALEATGGEISAEERRWADEALGNTRRRRSPAA